MQRINYFTNPNFTGPFININSYGGAKASYNTSTKQLNISGDNCGYGFNLSVPADVDLVFACFLWTDAAKNNGPFCVYKVNDGNSVTIIGGQKVTQNATNLVYRFHSPANGRIRIEFYPNGQPVNIANPIVELADTYDKAVGGGASGLLHGRHDAARIGASVGRVMSDDNHELMHEPILAHHPASRPVGEYHDHSEKARDEILGQRLCGRHRRHYLDERVWRHQCKPTCRLRANRQRYQCDVNEIFRQVRQSDRHSDEYAHLHVGRVSGEQDPARRHRIFHRGYDAARLTPLGVVA